MCVAEGVDVGVAECVAVGVAECGAEAAVVMTGSDFREKVCVCVCI